MSQSDRLATVYACDEDVAVRATGDFQVLTPAWQKLAQGTDGAFASDRLWRLVSATVDFQSAGVRAGHVVQLRRPPGVFKGTGELFAVARSEGHALDLRRVGVREGLGAPAAPSGGLQGVEFLIATLDPQIEETSYQLNRRFQIDPSRSGRTPFDLHDVRELRQACVLGVLASRYAAETRGDSGDFALKLRRLETEHSETLARLDLRWGSGSERSTSTIFSTRIVR